MRCDSSGVLQCAWNWRKHSSVEASVCFDFRWSLNFLINICSYGAENISSDWGFTLFLASLKYRN